MPDEALPELVLVEDNLDDEMMSLRGIVKSGIPCHITVRRDGPSAVDYLLAEDTSPPGLVLLDYMLPKRDGLDILRHLRSTEKMRFVPIVMLSATKAGIAITECYRAGANSCVTKPIDPHKYVESIAMITRYWLTVNETSEYRRDFRLADAARDEVADLDEVVARRVAGQGIWKRVSDLFAAPGRDVDLG